MWRARCMILPLYTSVNTRTNSVWAILILLEKYSGKSTRTTMPVVEYNGKSDTAYLGNPGASTVGVRMSQV